MMETFHFLRPMALLLLLPLAVAVTLLLRRRLGSGPWQRACDQALWPYVLLDRTGQAPRFPWQAVLVALVGCLMVLALAGPAWRELPQPVFRDEAALVVVLDVSRSMDAGDIEPSRLVRAKHKVRDILSRRAAGQIALVVYAAHAFAVTPLTDDTGTIESLLDSISTDIAPVQGSRPSTALAKARELLEGGAGGRGAVLLISDGYDDPDASEAATRLASAGIPLHVIAVGTERGAPVPVENGGFLSDESGRMVVPKLMADALNDLARQGRGRFSLLTADDGDLDQIFAAGLVPDAAFRNVEGRGADLWREEGPWLLLIALPLAVLGFRRGCLVAIVLPVIGFHAMPAEAVDWQALWRTPDQLGQRAFEAGLPDEAATRFTDPTWKAAALYRAGRYRESGEVLAGVESADAHYNRGNALAQSGLYEEAIAAYDRALALNPDHEDARYNRDLVGNQLPDPPPQETSEQGGGKGDGEDSQQQRGGAQEGSAERKDDRQQSDDNAEEHASGEDGDAGAERSADAGEDSSERQGADGSSENGERAEKEGQPSGSSTQQDLPQANESQRPGEHVDTDDQESSEHDRSIERMLSLVPDDPGELLRRKFLYQYRRAFGGEDAGGDAW